MWTFFDKSTRKSYGDLPLLKMFNAALQDSRNAQFPE